MHRRILTTLLGLVLSACLALPQGLDTPASKDDWEEINFEFNLDVLTDGFPSLLRLAELLNKNPEYKVELEGHADWVGSDNYNLRLGQRRAETVRAFLLKYGARESQVILSSAGERKPKVPNETKAGRWMNRRVTITVYDGQGRRVAAGGVNEAISSMSGPRDCCDEILKRLDKLDEILKALRDLKDENSKLRADLDALKSAQPTAPPAPPVPPLTRPEAEQVAKQAADSAVERVTKAMEAEKASVFSILRANVGADADGGLSFSGAARYFRPFHTTFALQGQGEFLSFSGRKEAQFDLGLVNRFTKRGQFGVFGSFKHVSLADMDNGAPLGQVAGVLDYIFSRGTVGLFGTKGFLDDRVVSRRVITPNILEERYLRIVDQFGARTALSLGGRTVMEANVGWMRLLGSNTNKPGGTIRLIQPVTNKVALTLEGGWNETLIGPSATGRVVAGVQFGDYQQPREYLGSDHPVPVDVPRIRYELLTRRVRTGNSPPVADAGPDQFNVGAGQVQLDGSASYDPDGDPITFEWSQIAGPAVALSGKNTAKASFTAALGQTYSFRLTVTDDKGAKGFARVTVYTRSAATVSIARFTVTPSEITPGQAATLSWQLNNATDAEITGIGKVNPQAGTAQVSPTQTTTYRLTARNDAGEVSETVTVVVKQEDTRVRIVRFVATPSEIAPGQASTLSWEVLNATSVEISGIGNVNPQAGAIQVSPTQTTTYRLTARNAAGDISETLVVTIRVTPSPVMRILRFTAAPALIQPGQSAALSWETENATTVLIEGIGTVAATGTLTVSPTQTTTYKLIARGASGELTSTATVQVGGTGGAGDNPLAPQIRFFRAEPDQIYRGESTRLTWEIAGATEAVIEGVGAVDPKGGSITVNPLTTTTFILRTKSGAGTMSADVTVFVQQPPSIKSFTASPATIAVAGQPVTLSWVTEDATSVSIDGIGVVPIYGSITVRPTGPTVYTLRAKNRRDTVVATVSIGVAANRNPVAVASPKTQVVFAPYATVDAGASSDPDGDSLTYTWTSLNHPIAVQQSGSLATIQLLGGKNEYTIQLRVTDSRGASATDTVVIRYQ